MVTRGLAAFLLRFFAYLCLSLALALALGPYSDRKKIIEDSPRVLVSAVALTDAGLKLACPDRIYNLPEGAPTNDQAVAKAILDLGRELKTSNHTYLETSEAIRFIKQLTGSQKAEACFRSQGQTFKVVVSQFTGYSDFFLVGVTPDQVQDWPMISPEQLKGMPGLSRYLAGLAHKGADPGPEPVYDQAETDIGVGEWQALMRDAGLSGPPAPVRAGDFLLYGTVENRRVQRIVALPGLRVGRLVSALLLLLSGLWFGWGLYRRRPGFFAGPAWTSLTGDLLLILVGTAGAYSVVELVQGQWWAVEPWLPRTTVFRLVILSYLPYLALCAWLKIPAVSCGLEVTDRGLVKYGPGRARTMVWNEIKGLGRLRESGRPGRGGLVIKLKRGGDFAPWPLRAAEREAMLSALRQNAPPRLQKDVRALSTGG